MPPVRIGPSFYHDNTLHSWQDPGQEDRIYKTSLAYIISEGFFYISLMAKTISLYVPNLSSPTH